MNASISHFQYQLQTFCWCCSCYLMQTLFSLFNFFFLLFFALFCLLLLISILLHFICAFAFVQRILNRRHKQELTRGKQMRQQNLFFSPFSLFACLLVVFLSLSIWFHFIFNSHSFRFDMRTNFFFLSLLLVSCVCCCYSSVYFSACIHLTVSNC